MGFVDVIKKPPITFADAKAGKILKNRDFPSEKLETFSGRLWVNGEFVKPFEDTLLLFL